MDARAHDKAEAERLVQAAAGTLGMPAARNSLDDRRLYADEKTLVASLGSIMAFRSYRFPAARTFFEEFLLDEELPDLALQMRGPLILGSAFFVRFFGFYSFYRESSIGSSPWSGTGLSLSGTGL